MSVSKMIGLCLGFAVFVSSKCTGVTGPDLRCMHCSNPLLI